MRSLRFSPILTTLALSAAVLCTTARSATAQQVRFVFDRNLRAVAPDHADVRKAVQHLFAGPSAAERAGGITSALPANARLLACRRLGATVEVTVDDQLLAADDLELAIEQIDKTVLAAAGVQRSRILVRRADGSTHELGDLLGHPAAPLQVAGQPATAAAVASFGSLAGRRIAISPGHGYYWHSSLGWTTQRGEIDGLIEDIHTAEICNRYLIPLLENLGAEIVHCREPGEVPFDAVVDNDQGTPAYVETGAWSTSQSSGYQGSTYRFAGSNAIAETATATWHLPVLVSGMYPVFAWFRASSNRTPAAHYRVTHSGGTTEVVVDQTVDDRTWAHLGTFWFDAQQGATVTLSNLSPNPGVVIADAVRLGGGTGSIARGGTTSQQPRWRECARYWTQFSGAPSSVYNPSATGQDNSDDVTARPRFAEWRTADAYLSVHTNAGGGSGTSTFIYSGGATAGSTTLSQRVHTQVLTDLRNEWNAGWVDRGQQMANFGELRLLSTMPGALIELAFHDTPGSLDHTSLHDPEFRYLVARALARGILRYFQPSAPFPPEPPPALRIVQDQNRGLLVAWDAAPGATHYTIESSLDGKGFVEVADVTGTSWSTGPLPHHSWRSFRVRAWNATGRSLPTEVLTAGTDHLGTAQALLVQGFDRVGRYVKGPDNTRDYQHRIGDALRRDATFSLGFDAASNEAVQLQRVALADYDVVVWSLGEESTADETFSATEQTLVTQYLQAGGNMLVHGAELAWDLDAQGSPQDRAFLRDRLATAYLADDAQVHTLQAGLPNTLSAGLPASTFDDGSGPTYDVDWPDVILATGVGQNAATCLRYGNGLPAGVQAQHQTTGARVVTFGFPLETILSDAVRAQLVRQTLRYLLQDTMPLTGPEQAVIGQATAFQLRLPSEANMPYTCGLSLDYTPGITLPLGGLLPLDNDALLAASLTPGSPVFVDFAGTLDGGGQAAPTLVVPNLPFLAGLDLYAAAFTLAPTQPIERELSNWLRVTLTQ